MTDVDGHDVPEWILAEAQSASRAHKLGQCLSGAMAVAVDRGVIATNPCRSVKLPRERPREPVFLAVEQVRSLADASDGWGSARSADARMEAWYAPLVWILATTGLRIGEARALDVADVMRRRVAARDVWRIRVRQSKSGRARCPGVPHGGQPSRPGPSGCHPADRHPTRASGAEGHVLSAVMAPRAGGHRDGSPGDPDPRPASHGDLVGDRGRRRCEGRATDGRPPVGGSDPRYLRPPVGRWTGRGGRPDGSSAYLIIGTKWVRSVATAVRVTPCQIVPGTGWLSHTCPRFPPPR